MNYTILLCQQNDSGKLCVLIHKHGETGCVGVMYLTMLSVGIALGSFLVAQPVPFHRESSHMDVVICWNSCPYAQLNVSLAA